MSRLSAAAFLLWTYASVIALLVLVSWLPVAAFCPGEGFPAWAYLVLALDVLAWWFTWRAVWGLDGAGS